MEVKVSKGQPSVIGIEVYRFTLFVPIRGKDVWANLHTGLKSFDGNLSIDSSSFVQELRQDMTVIIPGLSYLVFIEVNRSKEDDLTIYRFDFHKVEGELIKETFDRAVKGILKYMRR